MKAVMILQHLLIIFLCTTIVACQTDQAEKGLPGYQRLATNSYLLRSPEGKRLRITTYDDHTLRIQATRPGEAFFPDDHYEMVQRHPTQTPLFLHEKSQYYVLQTAASDGVKLRITKSDLRIDYFQKPGKQPLLRDNQGVYWDGQRIATSFQYDSSEHFTGLGHGYYGRASSIDLKGRRIERNYGSTQIEQAPLIVPFYLSSKGYGIFMNSTFTNFFNFGEGGHYEFGIDTSGFAGRMDYFFMVGPGFPTLLDHYTQLTGRPRLPPQAMFGLALSDKGHDHNSDTPSDEQWWRQKVAAHRAAGFPLDHIVNDNRWRAGGGKRCESRIEWDAGRYPDPAAYNRWLKAQGLVATVDFNRCIARYSEGWKPTFNIPDPVNIAFKKSAPDLTNPNFRHWFWQVFYNKTLNPALGYPNHALWIDEFDEMGGAPKNMLLHNGLSFAEMQNYWFFLIAKALVQEGWDESDINRRPFVWVRGMTAGAQRYATLWSGDIQPTYSDMAMQIRAMQLAGLSGFPFWGHDAGGFFDWDKGVGPDDAMYRQWAMAMGSFSPIWKPHGMGASRWPLDRSPAAQATSKRYSHLRYRLMPYLYSAAHQAAATGLPIARAMVIDYPQLDQAWRRDLQYFWGDAMLVAPNVGEQPQTEVWLPPGEWYNFWDHRRHEGDQVLEVDSALGELPLFVRAGAIIPMRDYAQSTAFIDETLLQLHIFGGADGSTRLYEDDKVTEAWREQNELRTTRITYRDKSREITIHPAIGSYDGAPTSRRYQIHLYGTGSGSCYHLNGKELFATQKADQLIIQVPSRPLNEALHIEACPGTTHKQAAITPLNAHKSILVERFGVTDLALFGSTVRGTARVDSDVDILVSFNGPATSKRYFGVQFYLEDLLKCPVDLVTAKALRSELRPFVETEAIHV